MEPIAIIGIDCSFPNAKNPQEFWKLLKEGTDVITKVPQQRWDVDVIYKQEPVTPGKTNSPWGSFLEGVDLFDANFFGISPRETRHLDPQQRLLLEVTWKALENAGIAAESLAGSKTGVFIGISNADYQRVVYKDLSCLEAYSVIGNACSTASNRLSYVLDLRGPSMAVDTACSSSLVAIHSATHSLQSRESNLCLVGGVNLILSPDGHIAFSQARMLAPDGRCKTFDAAADGYVRGEGCGVVVLKRLEDALRDGDNIQAIIKGSAVNQDGLTNGFTAPNGPAQQAVVRQALERAGVKPADISYVEAHGTGTSLGDPIEMNSLKRVLMQGREANQPCWIGSVKTNIGHLEAAAGIAGLIKVVLSLQNQEIPPHLNLNHLNPFIKIKKTPIEIPNTLQKWTAEHKPRLAGVSSFGFGGTNAHVILEEAPIQVKTSCAQSEQNYQNIWERPDHIFTLSAKCEKALQELSQNYQEFLSDNPTTPITDICFSANTGRSHFNHRLAIIASDKQDLADKLAVYGNLEQGKGIFSGKCSAAEEPPLIAFLFTGQGSQYVNMGRQLYETQPVFRQALEECDQILKADLQESILDVLYPDNSQKLNSSLIDQTAYTQPALFSIEYALYKLWESWGIKPDAVMGHSVGEYVAATVAGVFSLNSGLKLIAHRGRLMQELPPVGEMLSIMASREEVNQFIAPYSEKVAIAAINAPQSIVISGEAEAIDKVKETLDSLCIKNKKLQVSHAFHSHLMEPMLKEFEAVANQVTYNQPRIALISNVTGARADNNITTANYWVNHIRQPVNFADSMKALKQEECEVFIEIGAKPILLGMGRQCLPEDALTWLPSLRPGREDWQLLLQSLGELYVRGVKVDWLGFDKDYPRSKVILPTYPFQRQRYWIESSDTKSQTTIKDWFYQVEWKPLIDIQPKTNIKPGHWLIFADSTEIAEKLAQQLQHQGCECSLVYRGDYYKKLEENTYQLNPTEPEEFEKLIQAIGENTKLPLVRIIHLWSLDAPITQDLTITTLQQAQLWGCGAVLQLVKVLIKTKSLAKLWLVTRGALSVKSPTELVKVTGSPLWGMGRVISVENPQLWGGMVDLAPLSDESETQTLYKLIADNNQQEDHLALREKNVYVARLREQSLEDKKSISLKDNATYLITGGLGALGLHTARWMVSQGARHLVLTGRKQPSSETFQTIEELQKLGTQVLVLCGDISNQVDATKIFEEIEASLPVLKGVIHAAGVLDDSLLHSMNWEQFTRVITPKVQGAWHLHNLTANKALDFFVCFSSMASLVGSAAQANYAAANAFMDALVHHRRGMGLPGLSINWGPWKEGGMAANLDSRYQSRIMALGITPLSSEQGLQVLGQLLKQSIPQVGVLPIQWSVFQKQFSFDNRMPLLLELLKETESHQEAFKAQTKSLGLLKRLESLPLGERYNVLRTEIQTEVAKVLGLSDSQLPGFDQGFFDLGMDSLMAVELHNRITQLLGIRLPTTLSFDFPNIEQLTKYISSQILESNSFDDDQEPQQSVLVVEHEPIAIIGMGCSFPGGANTPEKFWELLHSGSSAHSEIPPQRWDINNYYDPDRETAGKMVTRYGHFINGVDQFDPEFFGISPREATAMDPQHRLLLEVSWQALERAGQKVERLSSEVVGVFVGNDGHDYEQLMHQHLQQQPNSPLVIYTGTGNSISSAAGRLAYTFGFTGPTVTIDTACSSSLVAIHQACNSIRLGECQMAIAGGVKLHLTPQSYIFTSRAGMISPDGLCKTFDISADGYGRGEGCGMVVLKSLSQAQADGDRILALIRGSAVNQDGPSSGLTVPNGQSQQKLILQALKQARVKPADISYLEAHGTGTSLGDPIEVNAAAAVLGEERRASEPLWIGTVKTNIGHLESAAGVSGLIKVVLSLQHQQIPAHLHLQQPNPKIDWQPWLQVPQALTPWVARSGRFAGVSSFGFTGTNAHVVLCEAPALTTSQVSEYERPLHLLKLSAKNELALAELAKRYGEHLQAHPEQSLGDICFSANSTRTANNHRLVVVSSNREQLQQKLRNFTTESQQMGLVTRKVSSNHLTKVAMLFTGQGSQYVGMGRQLYKTQPTFKQAVDQCEQILKDYLDKPLLEILYGDQASENVLAQTAYTQPALFAIEYALAQLWKSWGIKPAVVMGHSVGEYVAATVAGVFSLEDGLKLIAHRGRLMQQLPSGGEMLSIMASHEQVNQLITPYSDKVAIAAINGPQSVVISGESEAIATVKEILDSQQIKTKQLQVSHAFHSHLMEPMLVEFEVVASKITYNQPNIPLISNVTGTRADDSITTASYWVNHIRQAVKFAQSMETLHQEGCQIFLEIGPKPILLGMGKQCLSEDALTWLPSLRPPQEDWQQILQSLAELYVRGVKVDWLGFDKDYSRNKVILPTYPFQRQRYWVKTEENQQIGKQDLIKEKDNIIKKTGEIFTRRDKIIQELSSLIFQVLGFDTSSKIDIYNNLLEMGADSLTLMEVGGKIEKTYGINIPIRKFFEELTTLDALATYIDVNLSPQSEIKSELEKTLQQFAQSQNDLTSIEAKIDEKGFETFRESIMQQQLEVMSQIMSKQLEVLQNNATSTQKSFSQKNKQFPSASIASTTVEEHNHILENPVSEQKHLASPIKLSQRLNPEQNSYLEELIATYTKKTKKSKERALAYRRVLADKRGAVGFRLELKEMKYPIVGESSSGSRIWDIDGNEYIDISMGFGVHLFGHQPKFVTEALQNQIKQGMQIGPQAKLAGEVAQLIHELTGMERVAFCNSGTEAIMTALRLARLATGRDKIVIFSGSYHGQFDGTLAVQLSNSLDDNPKAAPILPGILQKMVDDVIVLKYDTSESLEFIKAYSQELAAVLVEPVQSRRPGLQPKEFLQQLRQLTQQVDIPLIFDEIITGFRIHPGGTQAWFGVEADIATYGKCVGGGIPIGIIAGKAAYMDGIDGGQWNYGDNSYPQKLQTFFAGTFNKNPLSMAAAQAVLKHLKSQGLGLQQNLNQRTLKLIRVLNSYFEQEYIPIKIINFGSMFRFVPSENNELSQPIELDILFYKLIEKGVYMWEGRNGPACFLSTAHTDEDIDYIISAVKDCISEMQQGGFFQNNKQQNYQNNYQIEVNNTERLRGEL